MRNNNEHDVDTEEKLRIRRFFEREDARDYVMDFMWKKKNSKKEIDYDAEEEEEEEEEDYSSDIELSTEENPSPYLHLQVLSGTAFDIFLKQNNNTAITLDVDLLGNRNSYSYETAAQSMNFGINLKCNIESNPSDLVAKNDPIKFCLSTNYPRNQFIGLAYFDWRKVLVNGIIKPKVELIGLCNEIVGVLQLSLSIYGIPSLEGFRESLKLQTKQEKLDSVEAEREFSKSMRIWWLDLMRLTHENRNIDITSKEIGTGPNVLFNQITPFSIRALNTPGKCLRYCHLLSDLIAPIGHAVLPNWAIVASRSGREREKLNVLVSLLRGFGLEAYVVISRPRPIAVVLNGEPLFFDVVSGKFENKLPKIISSVSYIYNESIMLANIVSPKIDWDIKSPLKWKSLSPPQWECSPQEANIPRLLKNSINCTDELTLEFQVKKIIEEQRSSFCMKTKWSYEISEVLMPIVAVYERQKQIGKSIENVSNESIKRVLTPYHTLKAVPTMTNSCDPIEIFRALMEAKSGLDVLGIKESNARFALRICLTQYPEGVNAVWAIFAVESIMPVRIY